MNIRRNEPYGLNGLIEFIETILSSLGPDRILAVAPSQGHSRGPNPLLHCLQPHLSARIAGRRETIATS